MKIKKIKKKLTTRKHVKQNKWVYYLELESGEAQYKEFEKMKLKFWYS